MTAARGKPEPHPPGAPAHERLAAARLYLIANFPPGVADGAGAPAPELDPEDLGVESVRWTWRVADAVRGGASAVQVRVKSAHGTALRRELLRRLRAALPPHVLLLVNDDVEAVYDERGAPLADGLHLGREDAAANGGLPRVRQRLGPALLLGTSTRTLAEVKAAREAGADHAGFGAMAKSATKLDTVLCKPAELARALKAMKDFPLFPIGGLGPDTLSLVRDAGGHRAAVGSAILDAKDPAAAARACLAALGR